jgi:hypothetical protein
MKERKILRRIQVHTVWLADFESNDEVKARNEKEAIAEAKQQFAAHQCKDYPLKRKRLTPRTPRLAQASETEAATKR